MNEKYTFKQDASKANWSAFPHDFKKGDVVYRFHGHTYGLDRDDLMYGGVESVPCMLTPDAEGFFTVPVKYLETETGRPVRGDYQKLG